MKSKTPRTDKAQAIGNLKNQSDSDGKWPWSAINRGYDFARTLELEIAELQIYKKAYHDAVSACLWMHDDKSLGLKLGDCLTTTGVTALKNQRDKLLLQLTTLK